MVQKSIANLLSTQQMSLPLVYRTNSYTQPLHSGYLIIGLVVAILPIAIGAVAAYRSKNKGKNFLISTLIGYGILGLIVLFKGPFI